MYTDEQADMHTSLHRNVDASLFEDVAPRRKSLSCAVSNITFISAELSRRTHRLSFVPSSRDSAHGTPVHSTILCLKVRTVGVADDRIRLPNQFSLRPAVFQAAVGDLSGIRKDLLLIILRGQGSCAEPLHRQRYMRQAQGPGRQGC